MESKEKKKYEKEILKHLDKYSERLLDKKSYEKIKQKVSSAKTSNIKNDEDSLQDISSTTNIYSKKRKKKRKSKGGNSVGTVVEDNVDINTNNKLTGEKRYLEELKNEMKLSKSERRSHDLHVVSKDKGRDNLSENESKVETLFDKHLKQSTVKRKTPEVVVFEDPAKRKRKGAQETKDKTDVSVSTKVENNQPEFDLKRARFEVQKFGIKGFQGNAKDEAMTALLVKLGAKPPKNKYLNYKEYQEIKKTQKEMDKDKREVDRGLGYKVGSTNKNRKRQRDKNDIGFVDGQVGKYKSGVQFVRKDELKGFDKKRHKR